MRLPLNTVRLFLPRLPDEIGTLYSRWQHGSLLPMRLYLFIVVLHDDVVGVLVNFLYTSVLILQLFNLQLNHRFVT